jgi:2-C-methyl-D-erythritol 4-phosphate cytidylyltransferase
VAAGPASGGRAAALIVAAGSGERLGAGGPKALVPLAGRAMFEFSLEACLAAGSVGQVVIAVPPGRLADFTGLLEPGFGLRAGAHSDGGVGPEHSARPTNTAGQQSSVRLVEGRATRSQSVAAGLELIDSEVVLVHDAARPLVTPELIDRAVEALVADPGVDAVIAAAVVTDTVKRVDRAGRVLETLDRSELRSVQTPQVFRRQALVAAIAAGDLESATDDASLIEAAGGSVAVIDAPSFNIKVTVPGDMALAEALLADRN